MSQESLEESNKRIADAIESSQNKTEVGEKK